MRGFQKLTKVVPFLREARDCFVQPGRQGCPLKLEKDVLDAAIPDANGKLLVLGHGLCRNDLQWGSRATITGRRWSRTLDNTPLYLLYNSGLHISESGQAFAGSTSRIRYFLR